VNEDELRQILLGALTEIAPEVGADTIDPATDLDEQLDIDSIDFFNLIVAVNERTGIEVPERDYPELSTLDGAVAYLLAAQRRTPDAGA
jgi:acyl carrier protein